MGHAGLILDAGEKIYLGDPSLMRIRGIPSSPFHAMGSQELFPVDLFLFFR